jgi:probable F420-dependent oxidoreductase
MKIGVIYPQIELQGDPDAVRRIGLATEELGFNHLLAYDHVAGAPHDREPKLTGPYTDKDPFHDPFVMFAWLAGMTKRIEFVSGVLILPQRQTVLVAKQATDLDLFSNQRFRMGVGVGWNYVEYDALGQDFRTRGARVDEQIPYLRRLWSEELVSFEGRFDRIDRGNLNLRPKRRIPIWIGGFSEVAFRRGAKLGDGYIFARNLEGATFALGRVRELLKQEGRDEAGFGLEFATSATTSLEETLDHLRRWEDLGGTHASFRTMGMGFTETQQHLDFIAEVRHRLGATMPAAS